MTTFNIEVQLSIENITAVYTFTRDHSSTATLQLLFRFIDDSAEKLVENEKLFSSLPHSLLTAVLVRDTFYVNEVDLLYAVIRWQRRNNDYVLIDLLRLLRWNLISVEDYKDRIRPLDVITDQLYFELNDHLKPSRINPKETGNISLPRSNSSSAETKNWREVIKQESGCCNAERVTVSRTITRFANVQPNNNLSCEASISTDVEDTLNHSILENIARSQSEEIIWPSAASAVNPTEPQHSSSDFRRVGEVSDTADFQNNIPVTTNTTIPAKEKRSENCAIANTNSSEARGIETSGVVSGDSSIHSLVLQNALVCIKQETIDEVNCEVGSSRQPSVESIVPGSTNTSAHSGNILLGFNLNSPVQPFLALPDVSPQRSLIDHNYNRVTPVNRSETISVLGTNGNMNAKESNDLPGERNSALKNLFSESVQNSEVNVVNEDASSNSSKEKGRNGNRSPSASKNETTGLKVATNKAIRNLFTQSEMDNVKQETRSRNSNQRRKERKRKRKSSSSSSCDPNFVVALVPPVVPMARSNYLYSFFDDDNTSASGGALAPLSTFNGDSTTMAMVPWNFEGNDLDTPVQFTSKLFNESWLISATSYYSVFIYNGAKLYVCKCCDNQYKQFNALKTHMDRQQRR